MKLYRRPEFLNLPAGTIYCAGKPYYFGELSVKGETWRNGNYPADFLSLGLQWIKAGADGDCSAAGCLDAMLENGASFPIQDSFGRDGGFDEEEIYLVYEPADLRRMIEHFQTAIAVSGPAKVAK